MQIDFNRCPEQIAELPRDHRGYPIPWFVAWVDGKPEFRVADGKKMILAINKKLCWVCGQKLNPSSYAFVLGPLTTITRHNPEPPCHKECAIFSAINCPFLSKPAATMRKANMPEDATSPGERIERNPGVCAIWNCRGYKLVDDGRGGILFEVPNPSSVSWYREARIATKDEVTESIMSGLPMLITSAMQDGEESLKYLKSSVATAMKFVH